MENLKNKQIPLGIQKEQVKEPVQPPVDLSILQPKVEKLNQLMGEKKPLNILTKYEIFKEVDFTIDEIIWLCVSNSQQTMMVHSLLGYLQQTIGEYLDKNI